MSETLLRSFLFAPGNHARRVEKALTLAADAVILDLEDAVATAEKVATRAPVRQALQGPRTGLGYVRVNGATTEFCHADLMAVIGPGLDGIVLPMVEDPWQLRAVDWAIAAAERAAGLEAGRIDLIPILETARGMAAVDAIARSGTRVRRMAFLSANRDNLCVCADITQKKKLIIARGTQSPAPAS